jgi:glycine reductase complex component B subunit gamma
VGIPVVQITAVPNVAKMVGVNRILRGQSITCVLGNSVLTPEQEKALRRKYVRRALEILQTDVDGPAIFTLDGTE